MTVLSYPQARKALVRDLVSLGYTSDEIMFLLTTADRKARQLGSRGLNERGARLGAERVRAAFLLTLGLMLRRMPPLQDSDDVLEAHHWGAEKATRREHVFIGSFHFCRALTMNEFYEEGYSLDKE
jgi:hypothetical protein